MLNEHQRKAIELVSGGHNLVLLGSAGTGKSHVVRTFVELCRQTGKKTALTCTTGIACSVYPASMGAMTIHRWSGVGDGRYDSSEIVKVITGNACYRDVVTRVNETEVLIIDECSMLSRKMLETIHEICSTKNTELFFGGMQVVLVGDFRQLPPVPCARYSEDGAYCFESKLFTGEYLEYSTF